MSSDLIADFVKPLLCNFDEKAKENISMVWEDLNVQAERWFESEDIPSQNRKVNWTADLRYRGQNFELRYHLKLMNLAPERLSN